MRGNDRVVILGHGVWETRFGGDPALVGRAIQLGDEPYTVVGILPPDIELRLFGGPERLLWLPKYRGYGPKIRATGWWNVIARLSPGVTLEQARAEMDGLSRQLATELPRSNTNTVAEVVPLRDHLAGSLRSSRCSRAPRCFS